MAGADALRLSKSEFFAWAWDKKRRYELSDAQPVAVPLEDWAHCRIRNNILQIVLSSAHPERWDVMSGKFALETGPATIRFPDVFVCERLSDGSAYFTNSAVAIFEVLAEDTLAVDLGQKEVDYSGLRDLDVYAAIARDRVAAWVWSRTSDRSWPDAPKYLGTLDAKIEVPALRIALPLAEIYRRVPLG